ncbi:MAG: hypothetical protein GY952_15455 [Rhodobacteraceae bacterium]|nr:hypothetical protein [Paracoccaceae bacterium]
MSGSHAVRDLLQELAVLYGAEGRSGGDAAAAALTRVARELPDNLPLQPTHYELVLRTGMAFDPQPLAEKALAALPYIQWGGSDLREDRIPEKLANDMPMCQLVGPDGMFFDAEVRVGLWMQTAGVIYGPRSHAAEETFLLLAGEAEWHAEGRENAIIASGATVHHPSWIAHTTITHHKPVLCAWRWSGEIGFDKYKLKD